MRHEGRSIRRPSSACARMSGRCSAFSFYRFPAEHWTHLRTTNPIESTYATIRLRTKRTKGCGMRVTHGHADHGVEAGSGGREDVAPADGLQAHHSRNRGTSVRRRRADGGSRLDRWFGDHDALSLTPHPQHLTISLDGSEASRRLKRREGVADETIKQLDTAWTLRSRRYSISRRCLHSSAIPCGL